MESLNMKLQFQFDRMMVTDKLFRSAITGQEIWDMYLASFEDGDDPVFRDPQSSTHNCNNCNNFIRRYGNIVAIDENYQLETIFDVEPEAEEFIPVMKALSKLIKNSVVRNVFFETYNSLSSLPYEKCNKQLERFQLGIDKNIKRYTKAEAMLYGVVKPNQVITFHHMNLKLNKEYVSMSGKSIESIQADYRDAKNVFQRGMEEISLDTLLLVKDLIVQGSLLNGDAHLHKIEKFIPFKEEYDKLAEKDKDNWCWITSYGLPIAKFRNELIGVLCSELAQGEEINRACQAWNKRVDPANYMKAVAPITETQKKNAQTFVEENGYVESFNRRFAVLDDIKANEIKHINSGDGEIKSVSIFDNVKTSKSRHKRNEFEGIEEVNIDTFMKNILPSCTSVEAYLENKFENNLVTMTTSNDEDCKQIFKWNNPYSWTYKGNLAGKSQLTKMVEDKGGRLDGVFRFSHSWNELEPNRSLMDLHVFMPGCIVPQSGGGPNVTGRRVGWNKRNDVYSGGVQDVDYTSEAPFGYIPVENITFPSISKMPEGKYTCKIHNWRYRQSGGKGKAEIAFGGEVFEYIYPATKNHQWITIAEIILKDGQFDINHVLEPTSNSVKNLYGLETKQFHKVNLICLSPNHWRDNNVGNKHYFFMLDKCKADAPIRSFHSENLESELAKHRKVLEILGAVNMLEPTDEQLSGIGFNATVRDEVILKLKGNFKRTIKVKF